MPPPSRARRRPAPRSPIASIPTCRSPSPEAIRGAAATRKACASVCRANSSNSPQAHLGGGERRNLLEHAPQLTLGDIEIVGPLEINPEIRAVTDELAETQRPCRRSPAASHVCPARPGFAFARSDLRGSASRPGSSACFCLAPGPSASVASRRQKCRAENLMSSLQERTEIRDGMRIDWNVPIEMDDGLVLRADVFRPLKEGRYPVILSYGPYAKNLAFQ